MGLEIKIAAAAVFLTVHSIAHFKGWYKTKPNIDMVTHFLGGFALGGLLKSWEIAIILFLGWEVIEMLVASGSRGTWKESTLNKVSDLFFGILGFYFGMELLI